MGIFNIFKTKEEKYYNNFKKIVTKQDNNKITISNLKVRVMTVKRTIESFSDKMKSLETEFYLLVEKNDNIGVKNNLEQKEELKLKLTTLFKIQNEFKQDFIKGVSLKIKELNDNGIPKNTINYERILDLVNTEIPTNYEKCVIFSDRLSSSLFNSGRHITDEEIKQFK
jgi:hypothetical protein